MKHFVINDSNDSLLKAFKPRDYKKFSNEMLLKLKKAFDENHYPNKEFLEQFALESNETVRRIENWFRCERKKQFQIGAICYEVIIFIFF